MRGNSLSVRAFLWCGCLFFAVFALAIGAVGITGVRATARTGQELANDELVTLRLTSRLGQGSRDLQLSLQALASSGDAPRRAQLGERLYDQLMPTTEADLIALKLTHGSDDDLEERAEVEPIVEQWAVIRKLINSGRRARGEPVDGAVTTDLEDAFASFDMLIEDLSEGEQADAAEDAATAERSGKRAEAVIIATATTAALATVAFGLLARWRFRWAARPAQKQAEFADSLQLAESEDEAHSLLHRHLERSVSGSEVAILNRNNSADRLESVAPLSPDSALHAGLRHAEPRSCLAVRSGSAHEEDNQGLLACSVCAGCGGRSLCTPLTVGGEVIGAVLVNRAARYDAAGRQRIRDSVSQAAPVLANLRNLAMAEQRAATDSLTGLPNKRTVGDTIKRLLATASRTSTPLCLLMLDLDHFRDINERFGHPVGDQALAGVGAAIRSTLRESDFAGRNGGEEFVVVLPSTDLTGGTAAAEKLRAAVALVTIQGTDLRVTASIGVAVYPDHAASAERLERSADSALYVAKRCGRNRVEVAAPPVDQGAPDDARELSANGTAPAGV